MANEAVAELADKITKIVADKKATISIRSSDGVYLYGNDALFQSYGVEREALMGKTLAETGFLPPNEVEKYEAEDEQVRREGSIVLAYSVHVQGGPPRRVVGIRVFARFLDREYLVTVSYPYAVGVTHGDLVESWERLELARATILALRLLVLT